MSEAIADVKGKAKDSLDELCSMVETLLVSIHIVLAILRFHKIFDLKLQNSLYQNEKEEKKEAAIRKLREMRQNYLDLRAKRTTLRKKYQALLVL